MDIKFSQSNWHTIVDHLHIVSGTCLTDPVTAGLAFNRGGSLLEDLLDGRPSSCRTTRHQRGTEASTLLTTGDTRTNEEEALSLKLLGTANTIRVVGVTAVNDDVTGLEVRDELLDEGIDSRASLDEEDDLAWALELCAKLLDGMSTLNVRACRTRSQ